MRETRNNCFGSKNVAWPFFRRKQVSTSSEKLRVAVIFRHSCLPVFAWRRVMLRFSTRNNCCEFLAFYGVITQVLLNQNKINTTSFLNWNRIFRRRKFDFGSSFKRPFIKFWANLKSLNSLFVLMTFLLTI